MYRIGIFLCLITGCQTQTDTEPTDTDSAEVTDTATLEDSGLEDSAEPAEECTAIPWEFEPAHKAIHVPTDAVITVIFSEAIQPSDAWLLEVKDVTGEAVLHEDLMGATFTPEEPLEYATEYEAQTLICNSPDTMTFTTVGAPLDPNNLVGVSYAMLYNDLTWQQPPQSLMNLINTPLDAILVQIRTFDEIAGNMGVVASAGIFQSNLLAPVCGTVLEPGHIDLSENPLFVLGPIDLVVPYDTTDFIIEDFTLYATFSETGETLQDIDVSGILDTRAFASMLTMDLCETSSLLGDPCIPCDDGVEACLNAHATGDEAPHDPYVDIIEECLF